MPTSTPDHVGRKNSSQHTKTEETSDESASNANPISKEVPFIDDVDSVFHSDESQKSFRRSSSLRVPKEYGPTSSDSATATQKKIVRFADVLGLDLANVRTFLQELPSVPKRAYEDLKDKPDIEAGPEVDELCGELVQSPSCKSLLPRFTMPVELADFDDRISARCVCLETVSVLDSPVRHITGRIKVKNLDYCKSVYIRYTLDEWKTYAQVRAAYVDEPDHEFYDKFSFVIYLYDTVAVGQRVEFAIEYHCRDCVYWDNNDGNNYVLECVSTTPYTPSYFRCLPPSPTATSCTGENFNSFY